MRMCRKIGLKTAKNVAIIAKISILLHKINAKHKDQEYQI